VVVSSQALGVLAQVFSQVRDRRKPRGVRHPLAAILALVFLGLLARIREMAVLERWAEEHWALLREPLGFTRNRPPHATTISRALATCSLAEFTQAFLNWLQQVVDTDQPLAIAVDGKTSCQGLDADGHPVQTLTALVHDWKIAVGNWSYRGEKTNEPGALLNHLTELLEKFPGLRLITGDAIYAQRPLAQALLEENCDYLVQIKANQPDIQDVTRQALAQADTRPPIACTVDKKGATTIDGGCGSLWTTPITFARRYVSPDAKFSCVLIGT
jgi:hypothetical protein